MLPSQPISHGAVSTSSTASIHNVACLWRIMCITYISPHRPAKQPYPPTTALSWQWKTDPKTKIVASDFVWCCRILSAIECTCIEMILSCPGKGYRVGSPIVAPNYVKLQMAIKYKKKTLHAVEKLWLYQIGTVCTTEYTANQHSFIHTLYQCTVPPPHALQGFWSSCIAIRMQWE